MADTSQIETDINATDAASGLKYKDADVIFTMPKRFLNATKRKKEGHKISWLIILIAGAIVLVGVFAGLYVYLSKTQNSLVPSPESAVPADETAYQGLADETAEMPVVPAEKEAVAPPANEAAISPVGPAGSTATPTPAAQPETVYIEMPATTSEPAVISAATDKDSDGLSDLEEILLDTNADSNDSDLDGYGDQAELLNLYNPAAGGQLVANANIKKYTNGTHAYSLYYPSAWTVEPQAGDDSLIFRLPNNQFVQILALENPKALPLEEWYKEQFSVSFIEPQQQYFKPGWTALKSLDGMNYYLANVRSGMIFTVTYNLGLDTVAAYKTVFEMMVKSFDLGT